MVKFPARSLFWGAAFWWGPTKLLGIFGYGKNFLGEPDILIEVLKNFKNSGAPTREQTYLYPSVPEEQLYIITNGCWQAWHTHFVDINNQRQGQKLLIIKRPKTSRPLCNPWREFFGRFYSRFCLFFNNRVACWLCHFLCFGRPSVEVCLS